MHWRWVGGAEWGGQGIRRVEGRAMSCGVWLGGCFGDGRPLLRADERGLRQILLNLLSNAIKFTPRRGRLGVDLAVADERFLMRIVDTGIGIAEADLTHALAHFGQIDNDYQRVCQATGLRLTTHTMLLQLRGG